MKNTAQSDQQAHPSTRGRLLSVGWLAAVMLFACGNQTQIQAQATAPEELKTVAEVRGLAPEQAEKRLPVRLRGVVTFWDQGLYSRFVQDGTAGIYLAEMTNMPALKPGQIIEIEGVTSPGEYAPIVEPTSLKVVGEGALPGARAVTAVELVSGSEDSQLVEVSGIVRSVRFEDESQCYLVDITTGGERFTAYAKELPVTQIGTLVDSQVKIRGVCSTLFNRLRQLFGFRLLVPRAGDIMVEKPAPASPFDESAQSIGSLLRFTPQGTYGHRVKVTGTVACFEGGRALFIQDEKEGLYAQTRLRTALQPGDRVEVLGFPAKGEYTPMLQDAVFRKIGEGQVPEPVTVDVDEALKGELDCRLVAIKANLLERTQRGREQFLVLESGGFTFRAYFSQDADVTGLNQLLNGSEVLVSGICLIERGSGWQAGEGWRAKSFRLLLPTMSDVQVIKGPPWWTQSDKLRVAGITSVLILIGLVLLDLFRRRSKA